jgi:hypothetical protein
MDSTVLIGRDDERRALDELIREKKNILIVGVEGVGKSAIVDGFIAAGVVKNLLYSKRSTTLKETLVNMIGWAVGGKDLQKRNILNLKKTCYGLLDANPEYVVLDEVGWVEPKFYGFLTYIRERQVPLVIVTRRADKKNIGHLWMGIYDFATLEIKNLDPPRASQLIEYYVSTLDLKIDALAEFKKYVFKYSEGNPKIIQDLCRLARNDKYRAKGYVDVRLMDLDRRIKSAIA